MALIEAADLSFGYDGMKVLRHVGLRIESGERVAVLGGNGSGKSTLAQWLAGWLPLHGSPSSSGTVSCDGRPWSAFALAERARTVQMVGQIPAQHLSGRAFTVMEEVAFGPENLNLPLGEVESRARAALAACRLEGLADRNPFSLSGGEQQRLVIAAALALRPEILILDEPFTNLDPESRDHVMSVLRELPDSVTLVLFETNPTVALQFARRFALLQDGTIAVDGTAREVLLHPATRQVLGLPAMTRAFVELDAAKGLGNEELPLDLPEAARLLAG